MRPFHLAFPVSDLDATRRFYAGILGCNLGRSAETWVDFDLYGHQLSAHLSPARPHEIAGDVDGHAVPIPHFGVVLTMAQWRELRDRLEAAEGVDWILRPKLRFAGQTGEQATLFVRDPSGNALEFKGFADDGEIFAS